MKETVPVRQNPATGAVVTPLLAMEGVTKRFGGVTVLDAVDFAVAAGEVHALLGENGAGKSTLMNVLNGIYSADAGTIRIGGTPAAIHAPANALAAGLGMVHQHFRLARPFSGRQNIRLAAGAVDGLRTGAAFEARLAEVMAQTGLSVPLDRPVAALSVAERQRIEILKALVLGARILILDEPTAVLTDAEAERLLKLVRTLADRGIAVVLITHKLREVAQAADRVSVLRRGKMVLTGAPVDSAAAPALSRAMVGERELEEPLLPSVEAGVPLLSLCGASVAGETGAAVTDVSLVARSGRIVGIAGVGGNGQQELAEAIVGLRALSAGTLCLGEADAGAASIWHRRELGLRFIPSDRAAFALAPNLSLDDNLAAPAVRAGTFGRWLVAFGALRRSAAALVEAFDIAGGKGSAPVRLLSGGNAQKAVLARELGDDARVIVAHSPTRGLDVSACRYVRNRLRQAANRGAAVLLITEDLEEVLSTADEIHVMSRGALTTTPGATPTRQEIGELMLGHA
ncbi:ABC transporter ATP-binding protein [Acuticoccus sp. MNP-M23]|uniref:ABC transporter ATP-binding protein n=1 Tax=Acuticoccus sp. MNP-M23 TaxID=3072793 RepID=UPI00281522BB|nr:ABC transporter ATP-binding protein [Acuticoccus sp. MNP-M23]WMS44722.1 ABC transporter ATP-binding protein [Acuticoccus sp. MNP-M23]